MRYFLYIFYRYYQGSKYDHNVAYLKAAMGVIFPSLLYLLSIYILIFPDNALIYKDVFLLLVFGYLALFYFLIRIFIKEKDLPNHEFQKRYRKFHGFLAVFYIVGALVMMGFSALYREKQQENIRKEFVKSQQKRIQPVIDKYRREHPDADAELIIADDSIIEVNPIP